MFNPKYMDAFREVKERVRMRTVAEDFGLEIGRTGLCRCPFHNDRKPSMMIYDTHYHCYACGEHGDVIDFYSKMSGIGKFEAVREMNSKYSLGLNLSHSKSFSDGAYAEYRKRQERRDRLEALRRKRDELFRGYIAPALRRVNNAADIDYATSPEWFTLGLKWRETLELYSGFLYDGDESMEKMMENAEEIKEICEKILR